MKTLRAVVWAASLAVVATWTERGLAEVGGQGDRDPTKVSAAALQLVAVPGTDAFAASPEDLAKWDYVEQEYYVSGVAKRYTFPDAMSNAAVVDGRLKVRGIERLRVADGSIMPEVTTGNTMAPCVVIGERAAELIKSS